MSALEIVQARVTPLALASEENTPAGKTFWYLVGLVQGFAEGVGEEDPVSEELAQLLLTALDYYERQ